VKVAQTKPTTTIEQFEEISVFQPFHPVQTDGILEQTDEIIEPTDEILEQTNEIMELDEVILNETDFGVSLPFSISKIIYFLYIHIIISIVFLIFFLMFFLLIASLANFFYLNPTCCDFKRDYLIFNII
jgi:hypothetical protein